MKVKDPEELSWTMRFILTGISFLVFSWCTKFIGGSTTHSTLFAIVGFIALGLGIICFFCNIAATYLNNKENDPSTSQEHESMSDFS
jgi:hypothetical protein